MLAVDCGVFDCLLKWESHKVLLSCLMFSDFTVLGAVVLHLQFSSLSLSLSHSHTHTHTHTHLPLVDLPPWISISLHMKLWNLMVSKHGNNN